MRTHRKQNEEAEHMPLFRIQIATVLAVLATSIAPSKENSWSRARRMKWTQSRYHLALSDMPKLIALEADQTQK